MGKWLWVYGWLVQLCWAWALEGTCVDIEVRLEKILVLMTNDTPTQDREYTYHVKFTHMRIHLKNILKLFVFFLRRYMFGACCASLHPGRNWWPSFSMCSYVQSDNTARKQTTQRHNTTPQPTVRRRRPLGQQEAQEGVSPSRCTGGQVPRCREQATLATYSTKFL